MGLDRSHWLLSLYLLLGVLLPAGCVLWFMNQAASSQEAAARQSVTEAYRNQLAFLRDRVDEFWQRRIAELESRPASAEEFARVVREGLADSVVFTSYPAPLPPLRATPGPPAQTMVRALVRDGNKEAAIQTIHGQFITGPQAHARDSQGRLMAADEQLLELKLLARSDARFAPALLRLIQQLNDYQHVSMPSAQRLFLMDEIEAIDPQAEFPTIEAERLAQQYLESRVVPPGVLMIESKTRRNIAFFRSGTILAASQPVLDQHSSSVRFTLLPPARLVPANPSRPARCCQAGASLSPFWTPRLWNKPPARAESPISGPDSLPHRSSPPSVCCSAASSAARCGWRVSKLT